MKSYHGIIMKLVIRNMEFVVASLVLKLVID